MKYFLIHTKVFTGEGVFEWVSDVTTVPIDLCTLGFTVDIFNAFSNITVYEAGGISLIALLKAN